MSVGVYLIGAEGSAARQEQGEGQLPSHPPRDIPFYVHPDLGFDLVECRFEIKAGDVGKLIPEPPPASCAPTKDSNATVSPEASPADPTSLGTGGTTSWS